ncbi:MAG TPA: hypothetical protein VH561_05460 [Micromonosporaceae bacterium]|jgi:hypothetical protein
MPLLTEESYARQVRDVAYRVLRDLQADLAWARATDAGPDRLAALEDEVADARERAEHADLNLTMIRRRLSGTGGSA